MSAPAAKPDATSQPESTLVTSPARQTRSASRSRSRRRRRPIRLLIIGTGAVAIVVIVAVVVAGMLGGSGPKHTISTPNRVLDYQQEPSLASGMGAQALRAEIVKRGSGEASHVVDAVYEDSTGAAAKAGPQILLFIGGNLSGSASSFISSFTGLLPSAFTTGSGALGGQAACVPGYSGHPAECAWADNDTFGLIASANLSATALANQLRAIRPLLERPSK